MKVISYDKSNNRLVEKQDIIHLVILVVIALVIGVYLIVTTVLIAKDGVFYIERAQQLATDPIKIIKAHPPGYPFLIMAAHKCATLFSDDSSVFTWIYSAQGITLLCRLLALIPLYFIGKLLVGGKDSFLAILILVILPHSANSCAEVLREWPYLLFLAMGFFFLLWSAKSGKWWAFGIVGLVSGLGYLIRPESVQLVVYALLWGGVSLFRPKLWVVYRWKTIAALALLFIGFAIPATPYMKLTGQYFPPKAWFFIRSFFSSIMSFFSTNYSNNVDATRISLAGSNLNFSSVVTVPQNILKALIEIHKTVGENLMWFFMPPFLVGLWCRFRNKVDDEERFLVTALIFLNITIFVFQYCYGSTHISRRWTLPVIALTVFYVPTGLRVLACWLSAISTRRRVENKENTQFYFIVLLAVGVVICLPKLSRPIGLSKNGYIAAAKWINENAPKETLVAVPDLRIAFYADRKGLGYDNKVPDEAKYIVVILESGDGEQKPKLDDSLMESYSGWVNMQEKKRRIMVYQML